MRLFQRRSSLPNIKYVVSRPSRRALRVTQYGTPPLVALSVLLAVPALPAQQAEASAPGTAATTAHAAVEPASSPGQEIELDDRATASSNTWLEPDGQFRTEVYPAPVNYETPSGSFAPIDNDLVNSTATGVAVENTANDYTVRLPEDAGSKAVKVTADGAWVSFGMDGLDGSPDVQDNEATYDTVEDADSVTYESTSAGVKESIVLDTAPAAPVSYGYDFAVSPGLTPVVTATGAIEVRDSQGQVAFTIPAPFMTDSATPDPAYSDAVRFDLEQSGAGWRLTVTPDEGWLSDPARVYPVTIDPTIYDDEVVRDCYISQAAQTASFCGAGNNYLKVGASGGTARRALIKFGLDELPANNITVTDANVQLYLDTSQTVPSTSPGSAEYVVRQISEEWSNQATWQQRMAGTTWTSPGGTFLSSTASGLTMNGAGTSNYKSINATGIVQNWKAGDPNKGVVVKQASPESVNTLLSFYSTGSNDSSKWPKLQITYTDSNITGIAPSGAGDRSYFTYVTEKLTDRMQVKGNVGSGNLMLGVTDLNIAGVAGLDFTLTRTYNSALDDGTAGGDLSGLSPGWSDNLGGSVRLEFPLGADKSRIMFYGPSGYRVRFEKNLAGDYFAVAPGLAGSTLKTVSDGYELTFRDKQVYKFTTTGRLDRIRDKQGNSLNMCYSADCTATTGKLDHVIDTRQRKIQFFYNTSGMLDHVEVHAPASANNTLLLTYTYTYTGSPQRLVSSKITQVDQSLLAPSTTDPVNLNAVTAYGYTGGRLSQVQDARETKPNGVGGTTTFDYYADGNIKTISRLTDDDSDRSIPDSTSTFTYLSPIPSECNNQGSTATKVDGERLDYGADPLPNPADDTTTYCVDDKYRVQRTVDAKGNVRKTTWTSQSNVSAFDDSGLGDAANTFSYQYNDSDSPTQVKTPTGATARAAYTDTANPTFPTSMADFDTGGDLASPTWVYDYDDKGNLIEAKADVGSGAGDDIKYRYCWDGDGQLTRIDPIDAGGTMTHAPDEDTSADACAGSPQGNDTLYSYNGNKELDTINVPGADRDVSYTYDALSRVKTVTDGRGVKTTFTYDALDHVVQESFVDTNTDTVTRVGADTATVDWTFDEAGNRLSVDNHDNQGPTTFVYDELNRVIRQSQSQPANAKEYFYDPADNLTQVNDESGSTFYTYDKVNLAATIDDPRPNPTGVDAEIHFAYDKHDKRTKTTFWMPDGNNVVQRAKYNDAGQTICIYSYRVNTSPLASETNDDPDCPAATADGLITYYKYDYTGPGQIQTANKYTTTTKGNVKWKYTYDPISRLTSGKQRNGADTKDLRSYEYTYDRHSNLTQEKTSGTAFNSTTTFLDMAYNTADELCWSREETTAATGTTCTDTPANRLTYTYDGAGALATVSNGLKLGYNVLGQTAQATPVSGPAFDMTYIGVAQDRRTQKGDLRMSYGFAGLSAQAPSSGVSQTSWFIRDPDGKLVAQIDLVPGNNEPDRYYLTDDQQSVMATISDQGTVRRYLYEPFGEEARQPWTDPTPKANNTGYQADGTEAAPPDGSETIAPDTNADTNPWRYASGYYDKETGMLKYGTRFQMTGIARWTQMDPAGDSPAEPKSINPYLYVEQNPVNATDSSGRSPGCNIVWDSTFWYDFYDACQSHDVCYSQISSVPDYFSCNTDFLDDMNDSCAPYAWYQQFACEETASVYHGVVEVLGWTAKL